MGIDGQARKRQFFAVGAEALSRTSKYRDLYACPLCLTLYDAAAIDTGELTLEHVPPRSMGGKAIALTCKTCNSDAGSSIDVAVRRREDAVNLVRAMHGHGGQVKTKARLTSGGVTTNVRIQFEGKHLRLDIPEKQNNPQAFRQQLGAQPPKASVRRGDPHEFTIRARLRFAWRDASIGDLKAAYIAAFARYGYTYALDPSLDLVRQQIREPKSALLPGICWIAPAEIPKGPLIVGLTAPFRGLLVRMGRAMVGLPWGGDTAGFYRQLAELFTGDPTKFSGIELGWPPGLEMSLDLGKGRRRQQGET